MLYFQGFEGIFGVIVVIFGDVKSGEMLDFVGFARSGYRSGIFGEFEVKCLGNTDFTRCALSGSRLHVLKCKPRPPYDNKRYYNSTVLWYVYGVK